MALKVHANLLSEVLGWLRESWSKNPEFIPKSPRVEPSYVLHFVSKLRLQRVKSSVNNLHKESRDEWPLHLLEVLQQ